MIDRRLMSLAPESKAHIGKCVMWKMISLVGQIITVGSICSIFYMLELGLAKMTWIGLCIGIIIAFAALRFFCEKKAEEESYEASVNIKGTIRALIYSKLLKEGVSYREKLSTSELMQLSSEGVEQLEIYFGRYVPQLFYSCLAPLTLFAVLSFVSLKAAAVLLLCVPLIPASIVFVQKIAKKLLGKYWGAYGKLGDSFLENLQGLTTLKIYSADEKAAEKMDAESENFRKVTMKVLMMQLNSTSVMDIIAYGGAAAGIITGAVAYISGELGIAGALMIVLLASEFFIPLRLLGSFFHIAMNGMAASDKMFALLNMEESEDGELKFPSAEQSEGLGTELDNIPSLKQGLHISNMEFSYGEGEKVLENINIDTKACGLYSFVGKSGCGKSTLAGILSKRNTGYEGSIRFGDAELSEIKEKSLMKNVMLVKHYSYIFKGTVRYNLAIAKPDATDDEMIETLQKVNLWDTLKEKNGLDTELLEKGSNFSGGQCQRLILARGLLRDCKVYIFDEATSSIDAESEEIIMSVIRKLAEDKLVFLISHRLKNCIDSECIYYMKNGRIEGFGKHDELMNSCYEYRESFDAQKKYEDYCGEVSEDGEK